MRVVFDLVGYFGAHAVSKTSRQLFQAFFHGFLEFCLVFVIPAAEQTVIAKEPHGFDLGRVRKPFIHHPEIKVSGNQFVRQIGKPVLISSDRTAPDAAVAVDLSEPDAPSKLFAAAKAVAPDLCAIVNNAAVFSQKQDLPPDELSRLRAVNVDAPHALTALLAANGGGAVVNIIDCHALGAARADDTPYLKSKRDLLAATVEDARSLAGRVRVNAVAPGPVLPPESCHERAGSTPLGRHPTPKEVADAVAYLLSAESTTGTVIPVDGGQSLAIEQ